MYVCVYEAAPALQQHRLTTASPTSTCHQSMYSHLVLVHTLMWDRNRVT